jgi:hypothetical protein
MSAGRFTDSNACAPAWKQYAAGGPYNLVADSPDGAACARLVVLLAAGDLTHAILSDGATDRPITGLPAGYQHQGNTSSITPTVAVVVYW